MYKEGSVHSASSSSDFSGEMNKAAYSSSSFHFEEPVLTPVATSSDFSGDMNKSAYSSSNPRFSFHFEKPVPPAAAASSVFSVEKNQSAYSCSDPSSIFHFEKPVPPPALPHGQPGQSKPQQKTGQSQSQQQQMSASPLHSTYVVQVPKDKTLRVPTPALLHGQPRLQQPASPMPGTYVVQLPKDKVFRQPPPAVLHGQPRQQQQKEDKPGQPQPQNKPGQSQPSQQEQQKPASPLPDTYLVQVPNDRVFRVPTPDNERLFKQYTLRAERRSGCSKRLRLLVAILCLVFPLAVAVGAVYLVYKPSRPTYTVVSLAVSGLSGVSNASAAGAFSPAFAATVRADNSKNGKVGVHYDGAGSRVTVSYEGVSLAQGAWPAFYQAPGNVTVIVAKAKGTGMQFSERVRGQMAAAERLQSVPFDVQVKVPVRLQLGGLKTWAVPVTVRCAMEVDSLATKAKVVSRSCNVKIPFPFCKS